ncbi:hypothetical protein J2129_001573 [Methanofollis sp. W23]|uniref:hypothetical protein n=1 Tax=Methanofollis sp. W23 TaxID=2817849 RepID=UPI001AE2AD35|nr:hypothetical protein [Methanofollis sp. W23]MBP2146119.1 hypothetical protein [Methanofollis sp. W23]
MSELLLAALGTYGEMSIKKFDEVFTELCLNENAVKNELNIKNLRRKAVRLLDAMGYCEFDFEVNKVYPCPPTLVTLPGGGVHKAVLTGVRDPKMLDKVKSFIKNHSDTLNLTEKSQNIIESYRDRGQVTAATFPSAILIDGLEKDLMTDLARECGLHAFLDVPTAWPLLCFCAGLPEYMADLSWNRCREDELNWARSEFSPTKLAFKKKNSEEKTGGLVEYINPITYQRSHWFWKNDVAAVVDRDWGRYIALSFSGRRVIVYDEKQQILVVPASLPLPRLLSRAATLCSGTIPLTASTGDSAIEDIPPHFPVSVYRGIPPEYSSQIVSKLGQREIKKKLRLDNQGLVTL